MSVETLRGSVRTAFTGIAHAVWSQVRNAAMNYIRSFSALKVSVRPNMQNPLDEQMFEWYTDIVPDHNGPQTIIRHKETVGGGEENERKTRRRRQVRTDPPHYGLSGRLHGAME